jgi:integrase/recombinase XerC
MPARALPLPPRFRLDGDTPAEELAEVVATWRSTSVIADSTIGRFVDILELFTARIAMSGHRSVLSASAQDCSVFLRSPTRRGDQPAVATLHLRRSALRAMYRTIMTLGVQAVDPTRNLELPSRSTRICRPLEDDEIALLRVGATGMTAALVAICGAGATTSEATLLTPANLVDDELHLPGAARIRPRTVRLDNWATNTIRGRTHRGRSDQPLILLGGAPPGSQRAQAAVCNRLRRLIAHCGIDDDHIRPQSLRLHRAATVLSETADIAAAARTLGLSSLDATSEALGHNWQENK